MDRNAQPEAPRERRRPGAGRQHDLVCLEVTHCRAHASDAVAGELEVDHLAAGPNLHTAFLRFACEPSDEAIRDQVRVGREQHAARDPRRDEGCALQHVVAFQDARIAPHLLHQADFVLELAQPVGCLADDEQAPAFEPEAKSGQTGEFFVAVEALDGESVANSKGTTHLLVCAAGAKAPQPVDELAVEAGPNVERAVAIEQQPPRSVPGVASGVLWLAQI